MPAARGSQAREPGTDPSTTVTLGGEQCGNGVSCSEEGRSGSRPEGRLRTGEDLVAESWLPPRHERREVLPDPAGAGKPQVGRTWCPPGLCRQPWGPGALLAVPWSGEDKEEAQEGPWRPGGLV